MQSLSLYGFRYGLFAGQILNHLNLIMKYYGNNVMAKMRMHLRPQERTHVRWLSEEDIEKIRKAAEELCPQYEIRIHLGLDLLLRKIEMHRLNVGDFQRGRNGHGRIYVLGKGRYGGKPAVIPFHPDTEYYLDRYLDWREEQVAKAMNNGEKIRDLQAFLIWYRPGIGIGREGYTTMDNKLAKIVERVNANLGTGEELIFSYHDLRRTGAKRY